VQARPAANHSDTARSAAPRLLRWRYKATASPNRHAISIRWDQVITPQPKGPQAGQDPAQAGQDPALHGHRETQQRGEGFQDWVNLPSPIIVAHLNRQTSLLRAKTISVYELNKLLGRGHAQRRRSFRRIKGCKQMPQFVDALRRHPRPETGPTPNLSVPRPKVHHGPSPKFHATRDMLSGWPCA